MSRPQRICAYCTKPGQSTEHIFGKRFANVLPTLSDIADHTVSRVIETPNGPKRITEAGPRPSASFRKISNRCACTRCNTGWMKDVHNRAASYLLKLAKLEWWDISDEERIAIAAYATLVTMSYEYCDLGSMVTNQWERTYLMENKEPPPDWIVNIGAYGLGRWTDQMNHKGLFIGNIKDICTYKQDCTSVIRPNKNIHNTVFTFGHILFHTASNKSNFSIDLNKYSSDLHLQTLYPLGNGVLTKPKALHSDTDVDLVAHGIEQVAYAFRGY